MRKAWCTEIHTNFLKCLPLSFINWHGEKWLNKGNDVSDGINDILASKTVSSCDAPCMQEVTLRNICDSICEKNPFRGNQQCCILHIIWKRSSSSLQCTLLRFASCFRFRGSREEWRDYVFEETVLKHLLPVKTAILCILPCYIWCHRKHGFTSARLASLSTSTLPARVHPVCAQHFRITSDSSGKPPRASVMTLRCTGNVN